MMFYDIRITRHINDKGDESYRTFAEADNVPLDIVNEFVTNYVSGEYEIIVQEHKEWQEGENDESI